MEEQDLILDGTRQPEYEEIGHYIQPEARAMWDDINTFLQEAYHSKPRIAFSRCSGKPGWNVKYQTSGKALCTLYPEKDGFIALVVVTLDLATLIENTPDEFIAIGEVARSARPFNGTKWLMIPVYQETALAEVKQLLVLKQTPRQ